MSEKPVVGIVGLGIYLPEAVMTAADIADATGGRWSEEAVRDKLGINKKYVPSGKACDYSQEMGALASLEALNNANVDPSEIDAIICITEEWKKYPLTTSACYVQSRIAAGNAWGIDVQNRCCTMISAMKMAKDMLQADDECSTVLVCGGYRNCDLIDFTDNDLSFMYNLACGGAAVILRKNYKKNVLLGTTCFSDGRVVHTAGSAVGGQINPVTAANYNEAFKLRLMDAKGMKELLNSTSMTNWYMCIDSALRKSDMSRKDIDYLAVLHMKYSGHKEIGRAHV